MALLLTRNDLHPLLQDPESLEGAFKAIEGAFCEPRQGEDRPTRGLDLPLTGEQQSLLVLPGVSPANGVTLRLYPARGRGQNPDSYVNLLFNGRNGQLLALMSGDELNVLRTGVPAGVGCRHLAPAGARAVAMLGSGRQARGQLIALRHALPALERVRVFSPTPEHRAVFAREMSQRLGLAVQAVDHPRLAVEDADVIGVASNARAPVLEPDWVRPGALVVCIAGGQLPSDLVSRARVIATSREDLLGGGRREPYASLVAAGAWGPDRIAAEMREVILGGVPGRARADEIVVYEVLGMPVWDAAIMSWAYRWAVDNGVGTTFELSSA